MTDKQHSELGASSAHRWIPCPGSIRLSAGLSDPGSIYAAEGTAAHEVGELCLKNNQDAVEYVGRFITVGNHRIEVDEDMAEAVQLYLDTIRADLREGDILCIEERFDLSGVILAGMFGTNDAAIYRPSTGKLTVYDYKHGAGYAVEVAENVQLIYYGIGAASTMPNSRVRDIELCIVQPRAPHADGPVRRWSLDPITLMEWIAKLKRYGEATFDPNAPLQPGEWCKFCRAAGICPALRDQAYEAAMVEFSESPADLTPSQRAAILAKADLIDDWVKAVRADAFARAEAGEKIPGYKLVAKRATRKWSMTDEETTAQAIATTLGLKREDLFVRKIASPAQVEKMLPVSQRPNLAQFVTKESSGLTLARESDKRAEVAAVTPEQEFGEA